MLISVIVPIYNVAPYLRQCLDSIINQTYHNLEIILVDDGSTDDSSTICDSYASNDIRVKVIHKENGGLSSARNSGLDIINGEWVLFVDADDWIDLDMIEILYNTATINRSDISCCNVRVLSDGQCVNKVLNTGEVSVIDTVSAYREIIKGRIRFEVWNKLFKSVLINDIRFIVGQTYEDVYFDRVVFSRATRISYIEKSLYNYRVTRPGNTNSTFRESRLAIFSELEKTSKYLKEIGEVDISLEYIKYAAETAMSFYVDASKLGCSLETKVKIIQYFDYFYKKIPQKYFKIKLFKLSPSLYLKLRK